MTDLPAPIVTYVPSILVDETSPPTRQAPADWIVSRPGGFALAKADEINPEEEHEPLEPGAVVKFLRFEDFGCLFVRFTATGYEVTDGTVDPRAETFMIEHEPESWSRTLAELADQLVSLHDATDSDPDTYTVLQYTYNNVDYLFEIVDGQPRFTERQP